MAVEVRVNLTGLRNAKQRLANFPRTPEGRQAFRDAATLYATAMDRRFGQLSRGGLGIWSPLAKSTLRKRAGSPVARIGRALAAGDIDIDTYYTRVKAARRKARKTRATIGRGGKFSILQDTGTLRAGLTVGYSVTDIPNGVRYGFAGPHPKAGVSLAKLATWHHEGTRRMPARTILVAPDPLTHARISGVIRRAAKRLLTGGA